MQKFIKVISVLFMLAIGVLIYQFSVYLKQNKYHFSGENGKFAVDKISGDTYIRTNSNEWKSAIEHSKEFSSQGKYKKLP